MADLLGDSLESLKDTIAEELSTKGWETEHAVKLAEGLLPYAIRVSAKRSPGQFTSVVGKFAIRVDDLRTFYWVALCCSAGLNAKSLIDDGGKSGAVGIALAMLGFALEIKKNVAELNDDNLRVLMILKHNVRRPSDNGLTATDIGTIIRRNEPQKDDNWVLDKLKVLANHPALGGGVRVLVAEDSKQRWRPLV